MRRAHLRGASQTSSFFFRKNIFLRGHDIRSSTPNSSNGSHGGQAKSSGGCADCAPCGAGPIKTLLREASTPISRASSYASLSSANSAAPLPGPGAAALEEAFIGKKKDARLRNCFPAVPPPSDLAHEREQTSVESEYEEMTMHEIICGKDEDFPGLLGVVRAYVDSLDVETKIKVRLTKYLDFIEQRADGSYSTVRVH